MWWRRPRSSRRRAQVRRGVSGGCGVVGRANKHSIYDTTPTIQPPYPVPYELLPEERVDVPVRLFPPPTHTHT